MNVSSKINAKAPSCKLLPSMPALRQGLKHVFGQQWQEASYTHYSQNHRNWFVFFQALTHQKQHHFWLCWQTCPGYSAAKRCCCHPVFWPLWGEQGVSKQGLVAYKLVSRCLWETLTITHIKPIYTNFKSHTINKNRHYTAVLNLYKSILHIKVTNDIKK